jgi:hypothetical protein
MPTKKTPPAQVAGEKREIHTVRLELDGDDYRRLQRATKKLSISKAAFARMAVIKMIRQEEAETTG